MSASSVRLVSETAESPTRRPSPAKNIIQLDLNDNGIAEMQIVSSPRSVETIKVDDDDLCCSPLMLTPRLTYVPGSALSALQESYDMRCGDRIAIGGYGFIYTARCRDSGQTVVVKHVIKPPYEGRFTDTPKCDVEAELLHKCKNLGLNNIKSCSGGVTTIFDTYSDIDSLYMVCKYEGNDLQRIIESTYCGGEDSTSSPSPLDWYTIRDSVLGTLTALHHCGILHNDIRPENITYYTDQDFNNRSTTAKPTNPTVKLIDFGLSTTCHCPAHCKLLSHSHEYANAPSDIQKNAIQQTWSSCTNSEFKRRCLIELMNASTQLSSLEALFFRK
ncbi:NUAK SNF1-like kinase 1 [Perkinsus chesapeaki]|uniref:NUAK SNF1-like kinase 1 n=1 Tax=Perkinsus chesapeaki TaxID=330153 RepID=A0A7J6MWT9_PERCH|nr:NUAK SNF1-like kinase 1 [Perkinsus chesapeaki]